MNPVEQFIVKHCREVPGATVKFSEFYDRFERWLQAENRSPEWAHKIKVRDAIPGQYPYGVKHSNVRSVGNLSWIEEPTKPGHRLCNRFGRLRIA